MTVLSPPTPERQQEGQTLLVTQDHLFAISVRIMTLCNESQNGETVMRFVLERLRILIPFLQLLSQFGETSSHYKSIMGNVYYNLKQLKSCIKRLTKLNRVVYLLEASWWHEEIMDRHMQDLSKALFPAGESPAIKEDSSNHPPAQKELLSKALAQYYHHCEQQVKDFRSFQKSVKQEQNVWRQAENRLVPSVLRVLGEETTALLEFHQALVRLQQDLQTLNLQLATVDTESILRDPMARSKALEHQDFWSAMIKKLKTELRDQERSQGELMSVQIQKRPEKGTQRKEGSAEREAQSTIGIAQNETTNKDFQSTEAGDFHVVSNKPEVSSSAITDRHQSREPQQPVKESNATFPAWALDPVTMQLMEHPVTVRAECEHTVSKKSLQEWLTQGNNTCPVCKATLNALYAKPNAILEAKLDLLLQSMSNMNASNDSSRKRSSRYQSNQIIGLEDALLGDDHVDEADDITTRRISHQTAPALMERQSSKPRRQSSLIMGLEDALLGADPDCEDDMPRRESNQTAPGLIQSQSNNPRRQSNLIIGLEDVLVGDGPDDEDEFPRRESNQTAPCLLQAQGNRSRRQSNLLMGLEDALVGADSEEEDDVPRRESNQSAPGNLQVQLDTHATSTSLPQASTSKSPGNNTDGRISRTLRTSQRRASDMPRMDSGRLDTGGAIGKNSLSNQLSNKKRPPSLQRSATTSTATSLQRRIQEQRRQLGTTIPGSNGQRPGLARNMVSTRDVLLKRGEDSEHGPSSKGRPGMAHQLMKHIRGMSSRNLKNSSSVVNTSKSTRNLLKTTSSHTPSSTPKRKSSSGLFKVMSHPEMMAGGANARDLRGTSRRNLNNATVVSTSKSSRQLFSKNKSGFY